MKKLNDKGFMLVEVIIVTVVVATIMVSLYAAFTRVYNVYELKSNYTNVDGIYALKTMKDYLIDNLEINELISNATTKEIVCSDTDTYCETIFTQYKVNKIYFVKKEELNNINVENETFKEYIKYLENAVSLEKDCLLIGEFKTNSTNKDKIYYYSYLEI